MVVFFKRVFRNGSHFSVIFNSLLFLLLELLKCLIDIHCLVSLSLIKLYPVNHLLMVIVIPYEHLLHLMLPYHSGPQHISHLLVPHFISSVVKYTVFLLVDVVSKESCPVSVNFQHTLEMLKMLVFLDGLDFPGFSDFIHVKTSDGCSEQVYLRDKGSWEFLFFETCEVVVSKPDMLFEFISAI